VNPDLRQSVRSLAVLAATGLGIAMVSIGLLYNVSVRQQGLRLLGLVREQARIIEAMAAHEMERPTYNPRTAGRDDAFEAVLDQVRAAQSRLGSLGQTGELYVARREGDSIVYLLAHRGQRLLHPARMAFGCKSGEPMYRALSGRSGAGVLRDYRGILVLAAYEPVKVFDLGVVAGIDLAEVRAPFLRADIIVLAATLAFIVIGGLLLLIVTAPGRRRLRESEERFRQSFEDSAVGKLVTGLDGRLLRVNRAFADMLGYTVEELQSTDFMALTHPDDVAANRETMVRLQSGTERSARFEKRYLHKDGSVVWVDISTVLLRDADGRPRHFVVDLQNITGRKLAEEEKERLAHEVERRKAELEQLIYAASHDLRTPLVSVQGFVGELRHSIKDLLAELDRPDLPPEFRERIAELTGSGLLESLRFIDAGTTRMSALLAGLLRLSRLDRIAFRAQPLDMNHVVGETVRSLEYVTREADARVEVADLPPCLGDPVQVGQVFSNLIENAFKYRSPDRALLIRITGRREGDKAVYCVEDNGIGIAPNQQERVFAPFFRVDAGIPGGEGLGLTIITRTVERLDGRVWVESEPGRGSRFYVALPVTT